MAMDVFIPRHRAHSLPQPLECPNSFRAARKANLASGVPQLDRRQKIFRATFSLRVVLELCQTPPVSVLHSKGLRGSSVSAEVQVFQVSRSVLRGALFMLSGGLLHLPGASAQDQLPLNLMPYPSSVQPGSGGLKIDSSFTVALSGYSEPRLERAAERFRRTLHRQTALLVATKPGDPAKAA